MQFASNFNNWRAVAHTYYGGQHLLYVGMSMEQVKKNYPGSFYELLQTTEQFSINKISLEKWHGNASSGHWVTREYLKLPRVHKHTEMH